MKFYILEPEFLNKWVFLEMGDPPVMIPSQNLFLDYAVDPCTRGSPVIISSHEIMP